MKKYAYEIEFVNGQKINFETDTNMKIATPQYINGGRFIVTENENVINVDLIKKMDMKTLK